MYVVYEKDKTMKTADMWIYCVYVQNLNYAHIYTTKDPFVWKYSNNAYLCNGL